MIWHGYMLLKRPVSGISASEWNAYLSHLSGVCNYNAAAENPTHRWHTVVNGTSTLVESVFDTNKLTTPQLATWLNAAVPNISYAVAVELLETNEGRRWQVFSAGAEISSVRAHVRGHLSLYGWEPRGPRQEAGNTYYVATDGLSENAGTLESPWSLSHVLSGNAGVLQKDTVYLRGGLYFNDVAGVGWAFSLMGYSHAEPIAFRGYAPDWIAGNKPIVAPEATITGVYLHFRNIVFTGRGGDRGKVGTGESGATQLKVGLKFLACHFVNNDSNGIATQTGDDTEIYMCLVAHNGRWKADNGGFHPWINGVRQSGRGEGSGHGMYIQGEGDIGKTIKRCIIFGNASNQMTIHGSGNFINHITVSQNLIANGTLNSGDQSRLVDINVIENHADNAFVKLGNKPNNETITITGNTIRNDTPPCLLYKWTGVNCQNNTFIIANNLDDVFYLSLPFTGTIDNNSYYGGDINPFRYEETAGARYTWAQWQSLGWDSNGTYTLTGEPSTNITAAYSNEYADGGDPVRGIVVVWNFEQGDTATVDLSGLDLENGQVYRICNAYNLLQYQEYTSNGTDNSVNIDLSGLTIAPPEGTYGGAEIVDPIQPMPPRMRAFIIEAT